MAPSEEVRIPASKERRGIESSRMGSMGPEVNGDIAPLLSGLVGRERSVALSLKTRSNMESSYGELGTDEALVIAVWLDCIDQRLIDAR